MSRIKEALVFKTDEERLKWFWSLSAEEQAEIVKESKEIVDRTIEAFRPVAESLAKVLGAVYKTIAEIGTAFALAQVQANDALCDHHMAQGGNPICPGCTKWIG